MANAPLSGTGWWKIYPNFYFWKSEIFLIIINFVLDTSFRKSELICPGFAKATPGVPSGQPLGSCCFELVAGRHLVFQNQDLHAGEAQRTLLAPRGLL